MNKRACKFLKVTSELVFVIGIAVAVGQVELQAQAAAVSFEVEVNRAELEAAGNASIEFNSYGGPYAVIETAEAIRGIGQSLGETVKQDVFLPVTAGEGQKYTLIHAVDSSDEQKLSADILVLNENAGVDHIKNLRRIISGYLETAYGYGRDDSDALAVFVTVYNAVYRGSLETFTERYSQTVLKNLIKEKAGLSTEWEDWAGKTQIVIPLGELASPLSSIDTTAISDEKVVEALRETDDKGVGVREQLSDIKERESVTASEKAKEAQKEATVQKQAGNRQEAAKASSSASKQQQIADRKQQEARSDREEIKKDKEALAEKAAASVNYMTGLFVSDEKKGLYTLITVNGDTGEVLRRSGVTQIRSKAVYTVTDVTVNTDEGIRNFPVMYLAVCGVNDRHSAVRLCLIDTEGLEVQKQSEEILSESTELIQNGSNYIAVIQDGKDYRIALYDKTLSLKAKSSVTVKAASPLNVTAKGLLVTSSSGAPVLLSQNDLTEVWGRTNVHSSGSGFAK